MRTGNTEKAEALNKSIKDMMKWFQDAALEMVETQNQQLKAVNELCSKSLNNCFEDIKKNDFTRSFNIPKEMIEMMQKNTKDFVSNSNAAFKKMMDFGQQQNSSSFSTDFLNKVSETFNKQMDAITVANQNYFDNFSKQTDTSIFGSSFDKMKTEFETNYKSSKKIMQDIVDSYSKQNHPTTAANKKILEDLNKNLTTMAENNLNLWLELISDINKSVAENSNETPKNKPNFHSDGKTKMSAAK